MATTSNIQILDFSEENFDVVRAPKKASEAIAVGDLIEINSGAVEVVDSADNSVFLGVALETSPADETHLNFPVATLAIIKVKIASGSSTVSFGTALKYSAGANGTDWQLTAGTVDGIAWALEPITAGNYGKVLINTKRLYGSSVVFQRVSNTSTSTSTTSTSTTSTSTTSTTTTT